MSTPAASHAAHERTPPIELTIDAPSDVLVGDTFPVAINVDVRDGASNFSFKVRYDPALLKFVGARQGDFMVQGNAIARLSTDPDTVPGVLDFKLEQDGGPPVEGVGGLVLISFQAVAASHAPMRIALAQVAISAMESRPVPFKAPKDVLLTVRR
jgi:general secretion pathway protein D